MDRQSLLLALNTTGPVEGRKQWIHLLPAGRVETRDDRGPYFANDLSGVIDASFARAKMIPVDFNHAIDLASPRGEPAPASGWIDRMEARRDGIWGLVEWTPAAAEMIHNREYRFISPVITFSPDSKEVKAILRASLTNNPNLTLMALNQAQAETSMDTEAFMTELRTALGIAADASGTEIVDAVKKLTTATNSADPAKFVPIETFQQTVAELNKLRQGVSLQEAERIVDREIRDGGLLPFMRGWAVSLCQTNASAYGDFISGAGKPVRDFITELTSPALDVAKMRELDRAGKTARVETDLMHHLGISAEDVKTYGGKDN